MLSVKERTELAKEQFEEAIKDYFRHVERGHHIDYGDFSNAFIGCVVEDSVLAKNELRSIFRESSHWNDEMDMLEVPVTIPVSEVSEDFSERVGDFLRKIFEGVRVAHTRVLNNVGEPEYVWKFIKCDEIDSCHDCESDSCSILHELLSTIIEGSLYRKLNIKNALRDGLGSSNLVNVFIERIDKVVPGAFAPGKKLGRSINKIAQAAGVTDMTKGSDYQKNFAALSDLLNVKSEPKTIKLFVSLNPAHFLTMSNPKHDNRGTMMTSCHSLNCTEYGYNVGCTGYARDRHSFIVFTAADPEKPETLNNRKTSRQVFMWGLEHPFLLQSRLYNATGMNDAVLFDYYREAVQSAIREGLGFGEDAKWSTVSYFDQTVFEAGKHRDFGGYADWQFQTNYPTVSTLVEGGCEARQDFSEQDSEQDVEHYIAVGESGVCIECGELISDRLYCRECSPYKRCECCNEWMEEDEVTWVECEEQYICEDCLENYYIECENCGDYFLDISQDIVWVGDTYVCRECVDNDDNIFYCDGHDEFEYRDCTNSVIEHSNRWGDTITVCEEYARESNEYSCCEECGGLTHDSELGVFYDMTEGRQVFYCDDCSEDLDYGWCDYEEEDVLLDTIDPDVCETCPHKEDCKYSLAESEDDEAQTA